MNTIKQNEHLPISVLVVDDHLLMCEMTCAYLNAAGFEAVSAETVEKASELIGSRGRFDVILLDLEMPGVNSLQGVERFVSINSPNAVVLFSGSARTEVALRAIEVGAKGFIPKTLPLSSLANAVRFAAAGETYLPHSVAMSAARSERKRGISAIAGQEMEVLKGICAGKTNKDIARDLNITEVAVKMHARTICAKLKVANRTQIAITALSMGLV